MRATAVRTPILIFPVGGMGMSIGILGEAAQGDRNKECPRGLGPGTSVKPWVPSGGVHPLVIQCYHCYEFWHRDRDGTEKRRPSRPSSEEEWKPEDTAAEPSPISPM